MRPWFRLPRASSSSGRTFGTRRTPSRPDSFGRSAILAFALICLTSVINLLRGRRASNAPAFVGLAYLFFDAAAYFSAGRNLQVIGFIAIGLIGVLVTAFGKAPNRGNGGLIPTEQHSGHVARPQIRA